jgi:hypothetical protein
MGVAFAPGSVLGPTDLDFYLSDAMGNPFDPFEITYSIFGVLPDGSEVVSSSHQDQVPVNPAVGHYYAEFTVPSWSPGCYRIKWVWRVLDGDPRKQAVQEFAILSAPGMGCLYNTLGTGGGGGGGAGGSGSGLICCHSAACCC